MSRTLGEGYFVFRPLGAQPIRGVREPVKLYEVLGLGSLRTHFQLSEQRGLTRFVGRTQQIAELQAALDSATRGNGCVVALVAEAGAGKSRLIHEFKATIPGEYNVLQTYASSLTKSSSYLPVIELLQNYFNFTDTDDEELRRAKVRRSIHALDPTLADAISYLLALLGLERAEARWHRWMRNFAGGGRWRLLRDCSLAKLDAGRLSRFLRTCIGSMTKPKLWWICWCSSQRAPT
ncbi:MAG: AAA family ATPase [Deltaproteobacteria bacterium]|nr:AAA family ATPase [Deltaproteobacteria bacterium]